MTSIVKAKLHICTQRCELLGSSRSKEVTVVAIEGRLRTVVPRYFALLLRAPMAGSHPIYWATIRPK